MAFNPRKNRTNYIQERAGKFYYRRDIPKKFRPFIGKTQWFIGLDGATHAARMVEAGALAHKHNQQMAMDVGSDERVNPATGEPSIRVDMSPDQFSDGMTLRPARFYRDGKVVETHKWATSDDPDYLREAEADGFFGLTYDEAEAQVALMNLERAAPQLSGDALELNQLKATNIRRDTDAAPLAVGYTLHSILPKMHAMHEPQETTKKGHYRTVKEFTELHGLMVLQAITRRHVADYVGYVAGMKYKGKPMAPTTVKQRLDKLVAILQFATTIDEVPYNVGKGVGAPKDTRPMGDQVYKPFTRSEVRKLVDASETIWAKRGYQIAKTQRSRETDLNTALHTLIWTGARPEEICQLRISDVDLEAQGLIITNVSDDLGVRKRVLKNEESVRGVPIHDRLVPRLTKHIAHIRSVSNSGLLFPSFEPELETGRYARPISTEWTATLRGHVSDDPQKVLYSLRHSWAGESKEANMPEDMRNEIMGHASNSKSTSARRYNFHFENLPNQLAAVNRMNCLWVQMG